MPSKHIGENTNTREYYRTSEMTDSPTGEGDIDYPSASQTPLPPSSPPRPTPKKKHVHTTDNEDFVEVELKATPSPSTSDIIMNAHLEDTMQLSNFNRELRDRKVGDRERKKRVIEMKEKLEKERDEKAEKDEQEGKKRYLEGFDDLD
jgi:hypothetical protein